ncbi:periplasmic binding protein-like I [Phlyctochytrium arcticum]|nr:periplasmic binding protein-like I [Phlyctochytrium arcticum]
MLGHISFSQAAPAIRVALLYPFEKWPTMWPRAYDGAQMAAQEIKALNWFPGVDFQVHAIDNGPLNAGLAIHNARDLVTKGYNGVIGERYSDMSKMVSYALSTSGIFQCSVWSTSPSLGKKDQFPTFFRLVADDNFQGLVMLALVRSLGWNKIGILASPGTYGQDLLDTIISAVNHYDVSVVGSFTYDLSDPVGTDYRLQQLKSLGARVILTLAGGEAEGVLLFRALNRNDMIGSEYTYIGGDTMVMMYEADNLLPSDLPNFKGLMFTEPLEYTQYSTDFINQYKQRNGTTPPSGTIAHYDATYAYARAFKKIMTDHSLTAADIASNAWLNLNLTVSQFTNFTFMGAMGPAAWLPNGDSASSGFHILNVQDQNKYVEVAIGTAENMTFTRAITYYGGEGVKPADAPFIRSEVIGYTQPGPLVIIALASISILVIAVSIPILIYKKAHPLLKPVSPPFMAITASGMVLCLLSIFVNAIEIPNIVSCNSYMALLAVGFGAVVGSIYVKLRRLYAIFDNKVMQRRAIPSYTLYLTTGCIVLGDLILALIWSAAFPLNRRETIDTISETRVYTCESRSSTSGSALTIAVFVYNAILVVACCYLAYRTRNIYSAYNEAKAIGIAIYNILFCAIIVLVVTYLGNINVVVGFIVRSAIVILCVGVTYVALIGRFLYAVFRKQEASALHVTSDSEGSADTKGMVRVLSGTRTNAKPPSTVACKSGKFPVRGQGFTKTISKLQWRTHVVYVMYKPASQLIVCDEGAQEAGMVIPLSNLASVTSSKDVLVAKWAQGALMIQMESAEEVADWVATIERAVQSAGEYSNAAAGVLKSVVTMSQ